MRAKPPSPEIWAKATTHGEYPEGNFRAGDVFRPGWTHEAGVPKARILQCPYANARMEYFRSRELAYQVDGPDEVSEAEPAPFLFEPPAAEPQPVPEGDETDAVHSSQGSFYGGHSATEEPPQD